MRYVACAAVAALALAACAETGSRGERDNEEARRAEARRDLERDCRFAARSGQRDPRCPQAEDEHGGQPSTLPQVPPPPPLGIPRT
jgi:hypothetical protein